MKESRPTHAAIVLIDKSILLDLLKFSGGKLVSIRTDPTKWNPSQVEMIIEHPDLPRTEDGWTLETIAPSYKLTHSSDGISVLARIDPPSGGSTNDT